MLKSWIARRLLRLMLPRLERDRIAFNRLLAGAVRLQCGDISDEEFRKSLHGTFETSDAETLSYAIDLAAKIPFFERSGGSRVDVLRLTSDPPSWEFLERVSPWRRRFSLLRHIDVRCDVLMLKQGEQIPPHGHHRVVSGFYLLEGQVACRHYDRVHEEGDHVYVRKTLDIVHAPGGYSTNSEYHQNYIGCKG